LSNNFKNVLEFIRANALFHSDMYYANEKKSFNLKPYSNSDPGVYFILYEDDILKIGKADGKQGLKGRVATYRTSLVSRYKQGDPTVLLWEKVMMKTLKGKILKFYLLPLPPIKEVFKGIEVELLMARSLEFKLSQFARDEGHSMLLSGQN
tara:strand:+ start:66 stop:518 length:453 start_codon:yes stop_codon:yes gene_type:complete